MSASGDLGYTAGDYAMTINNAAGVAIDRKGRVPDDVEKDQRRVESHRGHRDPELAADAVVSGCRDPAAAVKWMDAPPFLPKGAKLAVLVGDPSKPEPFTIRLQMPDGYKIAPHTHPTDEHVTVMSGVFRAAMGPKWDDKALGDFAPGSYANMAATMPHYAHGEGRDGRAGARRRPVRRQLRQSRGRSVEIARLRLARQCRLARPPAGRM